MPLEFVFEGKSFSVWAWADHECLFYEFLDKLQVEGNKDAERILYLIKRTAENGPVKNEQQCKLLEDGIYEFKAPKGARVLWFYDQGQMIICTHGFVKKKKKTPRVEIDRAKKIRRQYFEEKGND